LDARILQKHERRFFDRNVQGNQLVKQIIGLPAFLGVLLCLSSVSARASWWDNSVIYEIFVRSFQDSNSDGKGDLKGITQKLDYINSSKNGDPLTLGADAIWLMPIFQSPSYHGYDTIDYKSINPDYGTLDDFKNLVQAAHKRNIKVILDLAINHTSNKSPWFLQSRSAHKIVNNKQGRVKELSFADWYLWDDQSPGWTQGLGRWWPFKQDFYYSSFDKNMPDLNWQNQNVMDQVKDVLHYWSDLGVDGFRLDAARYYVKGPNGEPDTLGTHQVLQALIQDLKKDFPQVFFVGEIWASSSIISSYLNSGQELDSAFNFPIAYGIQNSLLRGDAQSFTQALSDSLSLVKDQRTLSPFLTNHDMVRIASLVDNDTQKLSLAAVALLTLPGSPVIYYGEEIGLANKTPLSKDDLDKRAPMQWDSSAQFGFTDAAGPWQMFSNASSDKNVQSEFADSSSLLSTYQSLIRLRKSQDSLLNGATLIIPSGYSEVAIFARTLDQEAVFVILNFGLRTLKNVNFTISNASFSSSMSLVQSLWGESQVSLKNKNGSLSISLDTLPPSSASLIHIQ
jgi:alpha-amylase